MDWEQIQASGVSGMCARATYGDPAGVHYDTSHFAELMAGARSAGFELRGAYHNLVKGDQASVNRQVDWLRSEMDANQATWAMLDVERYERLVANDMWPRFDDARRFADRWHEIEDRVLAYYVPGWMWSSHLGQPDLALLGGPLVESDYNSNGVGNKAGPFATVYQDAGGDAGRGWEPYGGITPGLWQFGSALVVPGASDITDVNAFRGTYAQLCALLLKEDDGVPVSDADIEKIARRVWDIDYIPRPVDDPSNPTTQAKFAAYFNQVLTLRVQDAVSQLAADVAAALERDPLDEDAVAQGIIARLSAKRPEEILAALQSTGVPIETLKQLANLINAL